MVDMSDQEYETVGSADMEIGHLPNRVWYAIRRMARQIYNMNDLL